MITDLDLRIYAATVRGEAEGEGSEGMRAVAWVIRNRAQANRRSWGGYTFAGVCLAPLQFSIWNGDSRRRHELLTDNDYRHRDALRVCLEVLKSDDDPTHRATHYYSTKIMDEPPSWASSLERTVDIKNHRFFREA